MTPAPSHGGGADSLPVGAVQFRPAWLAFPEVAHSGYPFWICRTNGSAFEDMRQRRAYGQFLAAAVEIDGPEIAAIVEAARDIRVSVCLGVNDRGRRMERGSVFCTAVTIGRDKGRVGIHRKLMPTTTKGSAGPRATPSACVTTASGRPRWAP